MNLVSQARLERVYPELAKKIQQLALVLELDPQPIPLLVSAGWRSWAEQDALFAQGRTRPGKIVTNARGGESWHNYGLAVDCEPELRDGTIDWNPDHPQWKRMEIVGESLGLTSGANWPRIVDAPHFQLVYPYPENEPSAEAKHIYSQEGAVAFWATLG